MLGLFMNFASQNEAQKEETNKTQVNRQPATTECDEPFEDSQDRLLSLLERMCDIMEYQIENQISAQQQATQEPINITIKYEDSDYDEEYEKAIDRAWRNFYRSNS